MALAKNLHHRRSFHKRIVRDMDGVAVGILVNIVSILATDAH
jgi:hypothetical protein